MVFLMHVHRERVPFYRKKTEECTMRMVTETVTTGTFDELLKKASFGSRIEFRFQMYGNDVYQTGGNRLYVQSGDEISIISQSGGIQTFGRPGFKSWKANSTSLFTSQNVSRKNARHKLCRVHVDGSSQSIGEHECKGWAVGSSHVYFWKDSGDFYFVSHTGTAIYMDNHPFRDPNNVQCSGNKLFIENEAKFTIAEANTPAIYSETHLWREWQSGIRGLFVVYDSECKKGERDLYEVTSDGRKKLYANNFQPDQWWVGDESVITRDGDVYCSIHEGGGTEFLCEYREVDDALGRQRHVLIAEGGMYIPTKNGFDFIVLKQNP